MASHAATLLWSLRAGRLLGTRPGAMIVAQCVGTVVGIVVAVPVYAVVASAYGIGTEQMPAPGALTWKATATAVASGSSVLPEHAAEAMVIAAVIGVALTVLGRGDGAIARRLPSPLAMGIGFVMPAYFGGAVFVGVLALAVITMVAPGFRERGLTAAAAGAMAGESLMGVGVAAAMASGWLG